MVYSPCIHCAKTIAASKIKNVYFIQQYKKHGDDQPDLKYIDIFKYNNINVFQLSKHGIKKILFWIEKEKSYLSSLE
jgi:deoxycytidylate deaminase